MSFRKEKKGKEKKRERIGRLEEHTIGYYRKVSLTLTEEVENEGDRELLLENVFSQLCEEALVVSRNQTVSTIIERLIEVAAPAQLASFSVAMAADWETMCQDRFASHVCQTLVIAMTPHMKDDDEVGEQLISSLRSLYDVLVGNLAVYIQQPYASHVVRAVMEALAGRRVEESVIKSKLVRHNPHNKPAHKHTNTALASSVPVGFPRLLSVMIDKLTGFSRLGEHAQHSISNPVFQTALLVCTSSDTMADLSRKIISQTCMFTAEPGSCELPPLVCHAVGSWLVQQVIHTAADDVYAEICELLAHSDSVEKMAEHPIANFVLQTLILESRTRAQFKRIYHDVIGSMECILAHNHLGLVQKLAEGCLKHGTKQQNLINELMLAFHCAEPVERQLKFATLVAVLKTYDVFYHIGEKEENSGDSKPMKRPLLDEVNLHGSLLLQTMLKFKKTLSITAGMLDMKGAELRLLCCCPKGSHVIDAFATSPTVADPAKERLVKKLKGLYVDLACHKSGSRALESLWRHSNLATRTAMATDMSGHEHRMQGDYFGRFVWRSCGLACFKARPQEWHNVHTAQIKKQHIFTEILDETESREETPQKKNKKKKAKRNISSVAPVQDGTPTSTKKMKKLEGSPADAVSVGGNAPDRVKKVKKKKAV